MSFFHSIVFGGYFFLLNVTCELTGEKKKNTLVSTPDCIQQWLFYWITWNKWQPKKIHSPWFTHCSERFRSVVTAWKSWFLIASSTGHSSGLKTEKPHHILPQMVWHQRVTAHMSSCTWERTPGSLSIVGSHLTLHFTTLKVIGLWWRRRRGVGSKDQNTSF